MAFSTFRYRSPPGHADAPDFAFDGHTLERSWSGSPVRISGGLVYLDMESTFGVKLPWFLNTFPTDPFLNICIDAQRSQLS